MQQAGHPAARASRETTHADDLGTMTLDHPRGTFAPTAATLVSLRAIAAERHDLAGVGIDWGSGVGCLAIAAARCAAVERVIGLEIEADNLRVARRNARRNGVAKRVRFVLSDSFRPRFAADRQTLRDLHGGVRFLLANPPSSSGDDGFEYRRRILRQAARFLGEGATVLLSISSQYGARRIGALERDAVGFSHEGVVAESGWVPFDQERRDLRDCLAAYVAEEERGGWRYEFGHPRDRTATIDAHEAMLLHAETGTSPMMRWQTHRFRWQRPDQDR